jgi:hypothetical protein
MPSETELLQPPAAEPAQRVADALKKFQRKSPAHDELESDVLFPLAGRMEQEWRNAFRLRAGRRVAGLAGPITPG